MARANVDARIPRPRARASSSTSRAHRSETRVSSSTSSRRAFVASAFLLALAARDGSETTDGTRASAGEDVARAVAGAREARARVAEARATLDASLEDEDDANANAPPLREIASLLNADAVKRLEANAIVIDAAVASAPLTEEERLAWRGVRDDEWLTTRSTTRLPAKRPNDFLCAVFSCYNDPRAPPSTDALLSLRLTKDGVRMGLRGDSRITAVGLAASLDDVLEKLDALLALVEDGGDAVV
jgi:hypothetical protein